MQRTQAFILLLHVLTHLSYQEDDLLPTVRTNNFWRNTDFHSGTQSLKSFANVKFAEVEVTITNKDEKAIFVENIFSNLFLEKSDSHPFAFGGENAIMTSLEPEESINVVFKFSVQESIPEVFYFCKVDFFFTRNNERFKQTVSFDKVNIIELDASFYEWEHSVAILVSVAIVGGLMWIAYKLVIRRVVRRILGGKIEMFGRRESVKEKKREFDIDDWLPKNVKR